MSEDKTSWNLPFAPEFTVDAEGVVRKGGKPLPSHGLVQAIKNMMERRLDRGISREDMEHWIGATRQGDQVVPWVLPLENTAGDGKPSTLIDRERLHAALHRSAQRAKGEAARTAAEASGRNPPPDESRDPVTRARMIPSVEPYPAHGDLARGWVVLELTDGTRVLLHGPSVAAIAPEFSPWK